MAEQEQKYCSSWLQLLGLGQAKAQGVSSPGAGTGSRTTLCCLRGHNRKPQGHQQGHGLLGDYNSKAAPRGGVRVGRIPVRPATSGFPP